MKKFKVGDKINIKAMRDLREYRTGNIITTSGKAASTGQDATYAGYHDKNHIKAKVVDDDGKPRIVIVPSEYLF